MKTFVKNIAEIFVWELVQLQRFYGENHDKCLTATWLYVKAVIKNALICSWEKESNM